MDHRMSSEPSGRAEPDASCSVEPAPFIGDRYAASLPGAPPGVSLGWQTDDGLRAAIAEYRLAPVCASCLHPAVSWLGKLGRAGGGAFVLPLRPDRSSPGGGFSPTR